MKRGGPIRRDLGKARDWERRSRKPMNSRSQKRRDQMEERKDVRMTVLERDRGCVAEGLPGVPHGQVPGRAPLEVHELTRGQMRSTAYLNPDWCIALCPAAHDWATEAGYPEPARSVGLSLPSWATEDDLTAAGELRDSLRGS